MINLAKPHCIWKNTAWTILCVFGLAFASLQAADLGNLDDTPFVTTFVDQVDDSTPVHDYTFVLHTRCDFSVSLTNLSGNVNLHLRDANGAVLAGSTNSSSLSESIALPLEPGSYTINVKQAQAGAISYTLSTSAVFIPDDIVVSGEQTIQDPEFDFRGLQMAWRDKSTSLLLLAPVDPLDGRIKLNNTRILDYGLALPLNGPEWSFSVAGSRIVYTKSINGHDYVAQAWQEDGQWRVSLIHNGVDGSLPIGNTDPTDPEFLVKFVRSTSQGHVHSWSTLLPPEEGGRYPGDNTGVEAGRWMPGQRSMVYALLVNGVSQLAIWDVDTGAITQITDGPNNKFAPFTHRAPEYGNETIITDSESSGGNTDYFEWTGVYRKINGTWTRIKRIYSPIPDLAAVQSPEPFHFDGHTYVSYLIGPATKRWDPERKSKAQVWISSIDPERNFCRKVNGVQKNIIRSDPEPFYTPSGAFVYYSEIVGGMRVMHRTLTGL